MIKQSNRLPYRPSVKFHIGGEAQNDTHLIKTFYSELALELGSAETQPQEQSS